MGGLCRAQDRWVYGRVEEVAVFLRQFFVAGLGNASYLVGSQQQGVCAVIDPQRDIDEYLVVARAHDFRITHILETHVHNDFVSGARELAARTGARIAASSESGITYLYTPLRAGDDVALGNVILRVVPTPGHTPEHISFLASDTTRTGEPWVWFSGGALLVGSVGRPDLLEGHTEALAQQLYATLYRTVKDLPDYLEVFPTHMGGSLCGKGINPKLSTTLGYERRFNPALQQPSAQAFLQWVLDAQPTVPRYWRRMRRLNQEGPAVVGSLPHVPPLAVSDVAAALRQGSVVLDARDPLAFAAAHIPGAVGVGLGPTFGTWVGSVLDADQPLILVVERPEDVAEAQRQLLRIGYERITGYVQGGFRAWQNAGLPLARLSLLSVHDLYQRLHGDDHPLILDVREEGEWRSGHIARAVHLPLGRLQEGLQELDPHQPVVALCSTGYRSAIAASLLARQGFEHVANVPGAMTAWQEAGYATVHDA